jgi:hypothetical protein
MKQGELLALGGLALLLLGGKKRPRGIVIPLDDELVQIRPPGYKPKAPPASLEDELAAQDEGPPLEERAPYVPAASTRPDTASPPAMTDELFASVAADASLPPSTAANVPPTQKEATSPLPSPARPTAPAAPTGTTEGPTSNVSPMLQPTPQGPQIPAGYDPAKARTGASAIASYLAKKGPAGYSREQLRTWQRHAALTPDGVYGGSTRGALIAFGVKNPPRPFFQPVATIPYVPPEQRT